MIIERLFGDVVEEGHQICFPPLLNCQAVIWALDAL